MRDMNGSGKGRWGRFGWRARLMRDDVDLNLVIARVEQEGDLFTVKCAPLIVMTRDMTIDVSNELSACEDMQARGDRLVREMQVIEKVRRCSREYMHWI